MLKLKLKTLEGLLPAIAAEYTQVGDEYILSTDVQFEDTSALKNALKAEKDHRKTATETNATLQAEVDALKARAGNATDLEKSWQKKVEDVKAAEAKKAETLRSEINRLLVETEATRLATEISTAPELILPHILKRLTAEENDGKFTTRVLDGQGKVSALSVNDLRSELVANPMFAAIITASKGSGGGASGTKPAPAGGKAFTDMDEAELVAAYKANPAEFDRMASAAQPQK